MNENNLLFDKSLLTLRRKRIASENSADFLLQRTTNDMIERLHVINRIFQKALLFSGLTEEVRLLMRNHPHIASLITMEPPSVYPIGNDVSVIGDEEILPFAPETFDLAISLLTLQWTNDLPGTLIQLRRALKPDGLFIGALIGGETLCELRNIFVEVEIMVRGGASPRIAPFMTIQQMGALLQRAGFALPVVDIERLTIRYDTVLDLMHDLRAMGATNSLTERTRHPLTKGILHNVENLYAKRYADIDGRIRATFELIWFSGWVPHESQQKPLPPGSAHMRLADALASHKN